jgi:hypothetical protein
MIELFFVTCLATAPQTCQERSLNNIENAGIMACMMQAQQQLAQWTNEHPNYRIARWSCRQVTVAEVKI